MGEARLLAKIWALGSTSVRRRGSALLASPCLDSALGTGAHLISLLELFIPDPSQRAECWLWSSSMELSSDVLTLALWALSH